MRLRVHVDDLTLEPYASLNRYVQRRRTHSHRIAETGILKALSEPWQTGRVNKHVLVGVRF
jgi:hypothetical protein